MRTQKGPTENTVGPLGLVAPYPPTNQMNNLLLLYRHRDVLYIFNDAKIQLLALSSKHNGVMHVAIGV